MHKYIITIALLAITSVNHSMYVTPRFDWVLANQPKQVFKEFPTDSVEGKDSMLQYASRKEYFDAIHELIIHGARAHEYDEQILSRIILSRSSSPIGKPSSSTDDWTTRSIKRRHLIFFLLKHNAIIDDSTIENALIHEDESLAFFMLNRLPAQERYDLAFKAWKHNNETVLDFILKTGLGTFK